MGLQDDNTWDIYSDRKNFVHEVKSFPGDTENELTLECSCTWGTTVVGWSGEDEEGNPVVKGPEVFVTALRNAHLLSQEQWPYDKYKPTGKFEGWPNQPPKEDDEGES